MKDEIPGGRGESYGGKYSGKKASNGGYIRGRAELGKTKQGKRSGILGRKGT